MYICKLPCNLLIYEPNIYKEYTNIYSLSNVYLHVSSNTSQVSVCSRMRLAAHHNSTHSHTLNHNHIHSQTYNTHIHVHTNMCFFLYTHMYNHTHILAHFNNMHNTHVTSTHVLLTVLNNTCMLTTHTICLCTSRTKTNKSNKKQIKSLDLWAYNLLGSKIGQKMYLYI